MNTLVRNPGQCWFPDGPLKTVARTGLSPSLLGLCLGRGVLFSTWVLPDRSLGLPCCQRGRGVGRNPNPLMVPAEGEAGQNNAEILLHRMPRKKTLSLSPSNSRRGGGGPGGGGPPTVVNRSHTSLLLPLVASGPTVGVLKLRSLVSGS